jgi:hypothetical protein
LTHPKSNVSVDVDIEELHKTRRFKSWSSDRSENSDCYQSGSIVVDPISVIFRFS